MLQVGDIENGVAIGHERTLFLAAGAQDVLRFCSGERTPTESALKNFRQNVEGRAEWAVTRGVPYVHVVFPDKQSFVPELWPFGTPRRLADTHLGTWSHRQLEAVFYPDQVLSANRAAALARLDTHLTKAGFAIVAAALVARVTGEDQSDKLAALLSDMTIVAESAGDLGSKLEPAWTESITDSRSAPPGIFLGNGMAAGNNGIIDIRISEHARYPRRVLIFGDSFARPVAHYFQWFFSEILFCRSPYFHPEVAECFQPDILITANAERYLSDPASDDRRPSFLLYPWLNGGTHVPPKAFAVALSTMLSHPRRPHD